MWSRHRVRTGLDHDLWLLLSGMSLRRVVMGFLEVVRPIHLSLIGFSPVAIGLIMTMGTVVRAVESLIFGNLSDKYGRKPFILIGAVSSIFRLVLYALSRDFWTLALAQSIGALGEAEGAGQPVVSGFIADKTEIRERSRIFSVFAILTSLSATIGALMATLPAYFQVGMNLNQVDANMLLFWLGVAINGLAALFVIPIKENFEETVKKRKKLSMEGVPWREVGKFSLIRSTDGLGMSLVSSLLPLYFYLQFGVSSENLAPVYAMARFLAIPSYFFVPLLSSRIGNLKGLIISRIVNGIIIAVFAVAPSFLTASALFIIYRLLFQFTVPMRQTFSTEIAKAHQTGTMIGMSNSARAFTQSIAPTVAGYLFEFASLSIPFFSGAAILAFNGLQYYLLYGRTKNLT